MHQRRLMLLFNPFDDFKILRTVLQNCWRIVIRKEVFINLIDDISNEKALFRFKKPDKIIGRIEPKMIAISLTEFVVPIIIIASHFFTRYQFQHVTFTNKKYLIGEESTNRKYLRQS